MKFFFFSFWCNKVCFGRRRKRLWVWEGVCQGRLGSSQHHTSHLGLKLPGRKCWVRCLEAGNWLQDMGGSRAAGDESPANQK